jgi:hypothetical protein
MVRGLPCIEAIGLAGGAVWAELRTVCAVAICAAISSQTIAADSDRLSFGTRYWISSETLGGQREILVSLPDGYNKDSDARYPVIFVLGGNSHFLHSVATAKYLATNADAMPEVIVVGVIHVDEDSELRPDFPNEGRSNEHEPRFREYLTAELAPYIDRRFRTEPYRVLTGHSLAGLFVLNTLRRTPDAFNAYFAFSPALWWDDGRQAAAIRKAYLSMSHRGQGLAMTMANEGDDSRLPYLELVEALQNQTKRNLILYTRDLPNETHNTTVPVAMYWALQTVFSGWAPDVGVLRKGLPGLREHYGALSETFGWDVPIPLDTVTALVFDFTRRAEPGDYSKARELVGYALAQKPAIGGDFAEMIKALKLQGHVDAASQVREALCNQVPSSQTCLQSDAQP